MRRTSRFVVRLLAALVLFGAVAVVVAFVALRGSLPRYDGTLTFGALGKPVTIERDALGSVTVLADNRRDLDFALGFVHAQERFFEMDLMRRRAAGELAEVFGAVALPADRTARAHRMRARTQAGLAALPKAQQDELDSYRDGVNAGLAALSVRPFAYLLTRTAPAAWRSEDTLLVIAAMAFSLNDAENKRELAFSRMHAALPDSAWRLLQTNGGEWDAPLVGAALATPTLPTAAELDLHDMDPALLHPIDINVDRLPGSNSFAVDGTRTGGAALIANDMHLDLRVPALWFRARLIYPDPRNAGALIDVSGASLPGTPAIIAGSNGHVAWGFTNSYIDSTDWVRVVRDPDDASRYRTAEGWAAIETHDETIQVHGGDDDTLHVEDTRWGPILAVDVDGTPLALAWTAQQTDAFNVDLERLDGAANVDDAAAIARASGLPPQNFVVADSTGAIAWTIAGRIPKRGGGFDASLPSDWSAPGSGWLGWLDAADVPTVVRPPSHRLWTANQRIVDQPAMTMLGDNGYDLGARAMQIRDDIDARAHFTPADMLAIQLDDRALFLERWKNLLATQLDRAAPFALKDAMQKALTDWSGHASIDSVAYRTVRAWRNEVIDTVMDGFAAAVRTKFPDFALPRLAQAEYVAWALIAQRPVNLLPPGYADWDALLVACAERTAASLDAQAGGLAAQTWGARNTSKIAHPLSRALPAPLAALLDMPQQPLPGDSNMPRVQGPAFGASERFAVAPGDEAHGYFMMPGGQSGHPLSPYYGSGHADWVEGKPTPFLPGAATHQLTLLSPHD